jgi:hypothetical protein
LPVANTVANGCADFTPFSGKTLELAGITAVFCLEIRANA